MMHALVQILLGTAIVGGGGEILQIGAMRLARTWKMPAERARVLLFPLCLLSPAFFLIYRAAGGASPEIGLGGAIGASVALLLLLPGLLALSTPLISPSRAIKRESLLPWAALLLLAFLSNNGALTQGEGLLLLGGFLTYLWHCARTATRRKTLEPPLEILDRKSLRNCTPWAAAAYLFVALALLITGADMVIDGSVAMALLLNQQEAVLGLTVAGPCTVALFLIYAFQSIKPGQAAAVIEAAIQSSLLLLLGALGLAVFRTPLPIASLFTETGIAMSLAAALVLPALILVRKRLGKAEGALLLALYVCYVIYLYR